MLRHNVKVLDMSADTTEEYILHCIRLYLFMVTVSLITLYTA